LGIDRRVQHLGMKLPVTVTPAQLSEAVDKLLKTDWDDLPIRYARNHLTEAKAYGRVFNEIDLSFCARSPEKCIQVPL
jgi:hypothetical protein